MRFISLALMFVFSIAAAKAAPPVPGADCGVGASVVGSRDAGKVTIGSSQDQDGCTLSGFSWPGGKVPSCSAMLESGLDPVWGPVVPTPYGTVSTATTLTIIYPTYSRYDLQTGHVVSYLCVGQ